MAGMFLSATLSTTNYDALLEGWNDLVLQSSVSFHGGSSQYTCGSAAETARTNMISVSGDNWTITDGGCLTNQIITFANLSEKNYGDSSFALGATADSELSVSYSISTTSVCTESGGNLTILAIGDCTITASQTGDYFYFPADNVTQTFTIGPDIVAPVITVPANITEETNSSTGMIVTYSGESATDNADGSIIPTCTPTSGSNFPIWTRTCTCTATDTSGNTSTDIFTITVNYNEPTTGSSTTLSSTMNVIVKFVGLGSGTITSNPSAINCNDDECQAEFDTASKVTLTATADSGSEFDYWSDQYCDTEMFMTNNHTCTAYFKLTPRTLTVSYPENGSITSSPAGIDCGNNKCSYEFQGGETINLLAIANDDYIFDS